MNDNQPPKPKMPGWRAAFSYSFAIIFDALKFIFDLFIFFAPVLAGIAANVWAGGGVTGKVVGALVGGSTAAAELLGAGPAIMAFGIIMAMAIALFGWMFFSMWFLLAGINPFGRRRLLVTFLGMGASVMPFINLMPTFTPTIWFIIRTVRKEDREARKKWEQGRASQAARVQEARQQMQFMQARDFVMQETQQQETQARMQEEAAAQDKEIPDTLKKAA